MGLETFLLLCLQFFPQQMASFSHLTSMMKVGSYSPMGHPLVFMVANSSHTINKSDFGSTGKWVNVICQWFLSLNDTYMEDRSFRIQRCLVWIMKGHQKRQQGFRNGFKHHGFGKSLMPFSNPLLWVKVITLIGFTMPLCSTYEQILGCRVGAIHCRWP